MQSRKLLLGLFAIVCVLALGTTAFAQIANFNTSSVPTIGRTTGITETAGDVKLTAPTVGSTQVPQTIAVGATLSISIIPAAAAITNAGVGGTFSVSAGVAPGDANVQIFLTGTGACGTVTATLNPTAPNTMTIAFTGGCTDVLQVVIRELRVNVAASGLIFPQQVFGLLTATPPAAIQLNNNNLPILTPLTPLVVSVGNGRTLLQCFDCLSRLTSLASATSTNSNLSGAITGLPRVRVTEGFASAFTTLTQEIALSNQPVVPTAGTQININIVTPAGSTIKAIQSSTNSTGSLVLSLVGVTGDTTTTILGSSFTNRPRPSSGITTFTYVVTSSDLSVVESTDIFFAINCTPDLTNDRPTLGDVTAQAQLAPLSTATSIIRFNDPLQPVPAGRLITIIRCATNILFPFVTNAVGLDTGLAIANTSTDPFGALGAPPQNGICRLFMFGSGVPSTNPFVTPTVTTGTVLTRLLSSFAAGFQGYIIAICDFQFGHGFAFIADRDFRSIAQGYLALIIPEPALNGGRIPQGSGFVVPGSGEALEAKRGN